MPVTGSSKPVASISFVPPVINTGAPDIEKIHAMVDKAIEKSRAKDEQTADASAAPKKRPGFTRGEGTSVGGSLGSYSEGYAANRAGDLSSAC